MGALNPAGGILGAALGESPADATARIEEAKKSAKDLSGLVRKKAKAEEPASTAGKRKAEDDGVESDSKKVKVEGAEAEAGTA